ncbi:MAG TPA: glycosyltransferase [Lacipirellulaceae bacterium]|nr:glycosyltransferase [Lacipirellulaceae bacterium]
MNPSITVLLPVRNAERSLRATVAGILELDGQRPLSIVIVDDASTDDTYETACELARDYPQVRVLRQHVSAGLGAILDLARRTLRLDEAIIHDGVGPINVDELAALIREPATAAAGGDRIQDHRGSRRFAAVSALNARMSAAHHAIASFHWLRLTDATPARRAATTRGPHASTGGVVPLAPATTFAIDAAPALV